MSHRKWYFHPFITLIQTFALFWASILNKLPVAHAEALQADKYNRATPETRHASILVQRLNSFLAPACNKNIGKVLALSRACMADSQHGKPSYETSARHTETPKMLAQLTFEVRQLNTATRKKSIELPNLFFRRRQWSGNPSDRKCDLQVLVHNTYSRALLSSHVPLWIWVSC